MYPLTASTQVTFPSGAVDGRSRVVAVRDLGADGVGVITEVSPFHPLDHTWPDQPGDTGVLTIAGRDVTVVDCLTGAARSGSDEVLVGPAITARRGEEGWTWCVLHVVRAPLDEALGWVGEEADLRVDADRRAALSAAHTSCHLMALALNEALATRWRKSPAAYDSLGHPDFDSTAIVSSRIESRASTDVYRLGKSLRKKGFVAEATDDRASLADSLDDLAAAITDRLSTWIQADAPVRIDAPSSDVTAPRRWVCDLPEGTATLMCGGTHLRRLGQLAGVSVKATVTTDLTELTIVSSPRRASNPSG